MSSSAKKRVEEKKRGTVQINTSCDINKSIEELISAGVKSHGSKQQPSFRKNSRMPSSIFAPKHNFNKHRSISGNSIHSRDSSEDGIGSTGRGGTLSPSSCVSACGLNYASYGCIGGTSAIAAGGVANFALDGCRGSMVEVSHNRQQSAPALINSEREQHHNHQQQRHCHQFGATHQQQMDSAHSARSRGSAGLPPIAHHPASHHHQLTNHHHAHSRSMNATMTGTSANGSNTASMLPHTVSAAGDGGGGGGAGGGEMTYRAGSVSQAQLYFVDGTSAAAAAATTTTATTTELSNLPTAQGGATILPHHHHHHHRTAKSCDFDMIGAGGSGGDGTTATTMLDNNSIIIGDNGNQQQQHQQGTMGGTQFFGNYPTITGYYPATQHQHQQYIDPSKQLNMASSPVAAYWAGARGKSQSLDPMQFAEQTLSSPLASSSGQQFMSHLSSPHVSDAGTPSCDDAKYQQQQQQLVPFHHQQNNQQQNPSQQQQHQSAIEMVDPGDGLGPLPKGWNMGFASNGETYFIDHNNKVTTWFDPRLPNADQSELVARKVQQRQKHQHPQQQQQQFNNGNVIYQGPCGSLTSSGTPDNNSKMVNSSQSSTTATIGGMDRVQQLKHEQQCMQEKREQMVRQGLLDASFLTRQQSQQQQQVTNFHHMTIAAQQQQQFVQQQQQSKQQQQHQELMEIDSLHQQAGGYLVDPLFQELNAGDLNPHEFDKYLIINDNARAQQQHQCQQNMAQ